MIITGYKTPVVVTLKVSPILPPQLMPKCTRMLIVMMHHGMRLFEAISEAMESPNFTRRFLRRHAASERKARDSSNKSSRDNPFGVI